MAIKHIPILNEKKHEPTYGYYVNNKKIKNLIQDYKKTFSNKDFYSNVMCSRCNGTFEFQSINGVNTYKCKKCSYEISFEDYQKKFINLNWFKMIDLGIRLYSWDSICENCNNVNPCISYCINESFGDERMCAYYPILLGKVAKLDSFIMKFCRSVNLFPDQDKKLIATLFCEKCDAPYTYEYLTKTFLDQKKFDIEFNIKKNVLKEWTNLKPGDITKLLSDLKLLER